MARALDRLYLVAGALAGLFLIAIVVIILLQVAARLTGFTIRGGAEFAGYALAAATFLALAHTFRSGAHIRINLLLHQFGNRGRWALDLAGLSAATVVTAYLAYYSIDLAYISYIINDVSQGAVATPLWIPQTAMALGAIVFAIAVVHTLIETALSGRALPDEGNFGPERAE